MPDGEQPEESVLRFMERLGTQMDHYYSQFSHLDSIKLNLMLELTQDPSLHSTVKFEDGQAVLDDKELLPLENIPIYSKNETVQQLLAEKNRMVEELSAIVAEYNQNREDTGLYHEIKQTIARLEHITNRLHQLEKAVLDLYAQSAEKQKHGKQSNRREVKALELVNAGDYDGAKGILRDKKWEEELRQTETPSDNKEELVREYISGQRVLISILNATGFDAETVQEITDLYEELISLAEEHQIEMDVLCDYAGFLGMQRRYADGIAVADRLRRYYEDHTEISQDDNARLLNTLGVLYASAKDYAQSESAYRDALEILHRLAETDPAVYKPNWATTCNNLAGLLFLTSRRNEAKELYHDVLKTYRQLAGDNPAAYEPKLANICSSLACLLGSMCDTDNAEKLHREALEIQRRLAKDNPAVYEPELARFCNSCAVFLDDINRATEAEELLCEALEIRRRLAKSNPAAFEPDLAATYQNYAGVLMRIKKNGDAKFMLREALKIYRRLAENDPAAYEPQLAFSYNLLGVFMSRFKQNQKEAKEYLSKALTLYEKYPHLQAEAQKVRDFLNQTVKH